MAWLLAIPLLASIAYLIAWRIAIVPSPRNIVDPEAPIALSFDGRSTELRRTILVPTLDTQVPPDQTVLWCATTALAWKRLENDGAKQPVQLQDAGDLAERLHRADARETDLDPNHVYIAAGSIDDGIVPRIRREMGRRFPDVPLAPLTEDRPIQVIAFSYLTLKVQFQFYFNHADEPLSFKDAQGRTTPVHAFGIRAQDKGLGVESYRSQVCVLFDHGNEFAIDLSRDSQPYQLVVAQIAPRGTLSAMLADLDRRAAEPLARGQMLHLADDATLLVPAMNWRVDHRFAELEGKYFDQPAAWRNRSIGQAFQSLRFTLNRQGAEASSGIPVALPADGRHDQRPAQLYVFDAPFLLIVKKRAGKTPVLVMWVADAELLQPK